MLALDECRAVPKIHLTFMHDYPKQLRRLCVFPHVSTSQTDCSPLAITQLFD